MMLKYKTMKRIFSVFMILLLMVTSFYANSSVKAIEENNEEPTQEVANETDPVESSDYTDKDLPPATGDKVEEKQPEVVVETDTLEEKGDPTEEIPEESVPIEKSGQPVMGNNGPESDDITSDEIPSPPLFYPKKQSTPQFGILNTSELQPGEAEFSKKAESIPGLVNTWKVIVEMWARDSQKTSDIVLVIDRSTSMSGNKLANAKTAAKNFVNTLLSGTYPNTRIALVSFGTAPQTLLSGNFYGPSAANRTTLNNAIDGISIGSQTQYTHTQAGIRQAQILLDASVADVKNIVLLSDGQPTRSYALNNTDQNSGNFPNSGNPRYNFNYLEESKYNYSSTVGSGGSLTSQIGNSNRWYHHGNSAEGQALVSKNKGSIIYTVALEAGTTGTPILNRIASPGKSYTATAGDLDTIFQDIAGNISAAISSVSVVDNMGQGFEIPAHRLSSITTTQGTANYNSTTKVINWNLGGALNPVAGDPTLRYAKLEYIVEITDDILTAPKFENPVGGSPSTNGELYNTNGVTTANFTNSSGEPDSHSFVSPRVNPVFYKVEKEVQSASGVVITPNRDFNVSVTGTGYSRNYVLNTASSANTGLVTSLRNATEYSFVETGDLSAYDVQYFINGVLSTDKKFNIVNDDTDDVLIKVVNKEKALGKLTIEKVFNNIPKNSPGVRSILTFTFKITGPNGYENEITLQPGESQTIENLVYGTYKVEELNTDGFDVTYQPTNGEVTLSFNNRTGNVTVTNRPIHSINVTATKIWEGNGPIPYPDVWFRLYRHIGQGTPVAVGVEDKHVVSGSNSTTTVTWDNMLEYDADGNPYVYIVKELIRLGDSPQDYEWIFGAPVNYVKTENGLTVTNTYQSPPTPGNLTYVMVNKAWVNVPNGANPVATFELFDADHPAVTIATASIAYPNTTHVFNGIPATKDVGGTDVKINYQVRELPITGYSTSPIVKTETTFSGVNRVTPNSSLDWNLGYNPSFVITKPTGNQPYIIWSLNVIPVADRAAFLTEFKTAAASFGANLGPFGGISIADPIIWIAGPNVSYDIYPSDPTSGLIEVNIEFNPDGTIADDSTIMFQKQSTWTQFVVGAHAPVEFDVTNTYTPTGSFVPSIKKDLVGRQLKAGEFSFRLYEGLVPIGDVVTNTAGGSVTFPAINYDLDDVGQHIYTVKEIPGSLPGVGYSDQEITITVNVSDNGDGTLNVAVVYSPELKTITNTYQASGKAQIAIIKKLTGRDQVAGEFTFEMFEGVDKIGQTTNTAGGDVVFTEMSYDLGDVGTKNYTIKEVVGSLDGVEYSEEEIDVTVVISDKGDGTLEVSVSYDPAKKTITNKYTASGSWLPSVTKELAAGGRLLKANEFKFNLFKVVGDVDTLLQGNVGNNADGTIPFAAIHYTQEDAGNVFNYKIVEVPGIEVGMDYDELEVMVTVTVTDLGNGQLSVVPSYPDDVVFDNTYTASGSWLPMVTKKLIAGGRQLAAGEFKFNLFKVVGEVETLLQENVNNLADGSIPFAAINYTQEDIGKTFTYKIVEVPGFEVGMDYDELEIMITVMVTDLGNGKLSVIPSYPNDVQFNNTYTAGGQWAPVVRKALDAGGRLLQAGEFKFNLYRIDPDNVVLLQENVVNNADGSIPFTALTFSQADIGKVFIYKIVEVPGVEAGMDYDELEVIITLTVSDAGDGALAFNALYPNDVVFDNTYTASGSWLPMVTKKLDAGGRLLAAGEFKFNLYRVVGETETLVEGNVNNLADGAIPFAAINYTQEDIGKTFTYKIVEVPGSEVGMDYDKLEVMVTVTVTDLGNGQLSVVPSYPEDVEFNNTYLASGQWLPEVTKRLVAGGRLLIANEFKFNLYLVDGDIETLLQENVGNLVDGSIPFTSLNYTQADIGKVFNYKITEVLGSETGMDYDELDILITVTVTDLGNGELSVVPTYPDDTQFDNFYEARGSWIPAVQKFLDAGGRKLKAEEFMFRLLDSEDNILQTATNTSTGSVTFDAVVYDEEAIGKTFMYKIVEVPGSELGMSYDPMEVVISVVVTDLGNGLLSVVPTYPDDVQFDNEYLAEGSWTLEVMKHLDGRDLVAEEFEFVLTMGETLIETVTNSGDGMVRFSPLNFTQEDIGKEFVYTVKEVEGSLGGVDYDETEITVTLKVTDGGDGELVFEALYSQETFTNEYSALPVSVVFEGHKVLEGRDLNAGEFEFELYRSDDLGTLLGMPLAVVTNAADGTVLFDPLTFEFGQEGTYYFVIVEKAGSLGGVDYDENHIRIKVVIVDDLEGQMEAFVDYEDELQTFVNLYEAQPVDVRIEGMKALIGRNLLDEEFEFELLDEEHRVVATAKNIAGKIVFDLTFEEIGIYEFTLRENAGTLPFVEYDESEFDIKVVVTDNLEGQLLARVEHPEIMFENEYRTNPSIEIEKQARLVNGQEAFMLTGEIIEYVVTATNTGDIKLINVEIEDEKLGLYDVRFDIIHVDGTRTSDVVNGQVTLLPGEKLEMVALYATTLEDLQALIVINIANVKGYEPDPEDETQPKDPENPVRPDEPVEAEVPGAEPDPLPETGTNMINPLLSLAMVSAGIYLLLRKKKEDYED